MQPVARRSILQSGALAAMALGIGTGWPSARSCAAGTTHFAPVSGLLAAWVMFDPDRGATIRLAQRSHPDEPAQEIAAVYYGCNELQRITASASRSGTVRDAHAAATHFARTVAARSWNVPYSECRVELGRIAHPNSGRVAAFCVWMDFV